MQAKEVKKIASLAHLQIKEDEAQVFSEQLEAILSHFSQISKLKTKEVLPLHSPIQNSLRLRFDQVQELDSKDLEDFFENCPDKQRNLFKVPPTF